jgi:hypothetical protein
LVGRVKKQASFGKQITRSEPVDPSASHEWGKTLVQCCDAWNRIEDTEMNQRVVEIGSLGSQNSAELADRAIERELVRGDGSWLSCFVDPRDMILATVL